MRSPPEPEAKVKPDDEFRRATRDVKRLPAPRRIKLTRAPAAPVPVQTRRDERAALAESLAGPSSIDDAIDSGEELAFLRDGLSRQVLRQPRQPFGHADARAVAEVAPRRVDVEPVRGRQLFDQESRQPRLGRDAERPV